MIGEKIKERRIELGLTQEELATIVGYTSKSSINKIEKNCQDIPRETLIRLSEALQVSPSYFLDNDTAIENESKKISAFRINEAMTDIGMSQQELADLTNIGKASISHYVNGLHQPSNKAVLALANILGVNPAWIMGYDVPKYDKNSRIIVSKRNDNDVEEIKKAVKLYRKYLNASPDVRKAIDLLLKQSKSR